MNDTTDYRLINQRNREIKLRNQRRDILKADGQEALSMILDAPAPATLIQSFPDQDLYYLMHKIGPDDFVPVLSMARSDQWEYILDVDVWDNDRLNTEMMTRVFDILFQADPQRLLRWTITEKPDFLEFYLLKNMTVFIREHDDVPPSDFDDYITLDDKFYFRFPDRPAGDPDDPDGDPMPVPGNSRPAWDLIETMLKMVAEMDLSVFHGLLLETSALLPSETEEEQFRLKTLRLAEKGFLPAHEAVGIYQPAGKSSLVKRPAKLKPAPGHFDPQVPMPPQFFTGLLDEDNLFVQTIPLFDNRVHPVLEAELAALINKVISADRIRLRGKDDLEAAMSKACSYLHLGLELLIDKAPSPESAKPIIEDFFLEDIFRTGSRAGIHLKTKAQQWFTQSAMNKNNLPLSFLGERYLGVIGGLMIERPMFFTGSSADPYANFKTLDHILTTRKKLEQIIAIDAFTGKIMEHSDLDLSTFRQGILTYKTLILTLWAKDRLNLEPDLSPIPTDVFKPFFIQLFAKENAKQGTGLPPASPLTDLVLFIKEITGFSSETFPADSESVISELIKELKADYGAVSPQDIDPRFIPHFLLKKTD